MDRHVLASFLAPSAESVDPLLGRSVDVHISVVSHNNPQALKRCLATLPGACSGLIWGVTVVENVVRTGWAVQEDFDWARVLINSRPAGFAANHNSVIAPLLLHGGTRYFLVLNDDTELADGSVATLVRWADQNPACAAVGPVTFFPDGTPQASYFSFPRPLPYLISCILPRFPYVQPTEGTGWLGGACLLLRAEALEKVGLFDTRYFMFFEDVDLAGRLWDSGWEVAVCPGASIVHYGHQTVARDDLSMEMERQMIRSCSLYFHQKWGPWVGTLLMAGRSLLTVLRAVATLTKGVCLRDRARVALARRQLILAFYRPSRMLSHERVAAGSGLQTCPE